MTLSNWIELAVAVVILIAGISLYVHFRRKFKSMDGFEGIMTERSDGRYRETQDMETEQDRLQELIK